MLDGLQTEQGFSPGSTESTRSIKRMSFTCRTSLCDNSVYNFIGHNMMTLDSRIGSQRGQLQYTIGTNSNLNGKSHD